VTSISASVVLDSMSPYDDTRLTTLELEFPRFILAEFNTHRKFSRSSASSRAIPIKKLVERVEKDPFVPEVFTKAQPGMASNEPVEDQDKARKAWLYSAYHAAESVKCLDRLGVHKQHANRLLEPFLWHTTLVTATEWENFLMQRDHPQAQPEIQQLASSIAAAIKASTPVYRRNHLPFFSFEGEKAPTRNVFISVGRCATVSYDNLGQGIDEEKDFARAVKMKDSRPIHYSPAEHVAYAAPGDHANFNGWLQERWYWERGYR
jgi:thymidylate synthase ThyX